MTEFSLSEYLAKELVSMGYKKVQVLLNGWTRWQAAGPRRKRRDRPFGWPERMTMETDHKIEHGPESSETAEHVHGSTNG